jgi:hypothetical protein
MFSTNKSSSHPHSNQNNHPPPKRNKTNHPTNTDTPSCNEYIIILQVVVILYLLILYVCLLFPIVQIETIHNGLFLSRPKRSRRNLIQKSNVLRKKLNK